MSKKKKGKVVQLTPNRQSPENYIRTQARSLPIAECLISEDWEEVGICNVLVARSHTNGNFTVGIYLVDLYCLGVKDAWYQFNISPDEYEHIKNRLGDIVEECEYVLAHNVIYGAAAYAEDYGFKPQKGFDIAQFVLEEDDDRIELIELEFGLDGKPFYAYSPYDDAAEVKRIMATLERTAGPDNFLSEEVGDDDLDDEDWDDDEFDEDNEYDEFEGHAGTIEDLLRMLKLTNKVYEKIYRTPETIAIIKKNTMSKGYRLSDDRKKMDQNSFDTPEQEDLYRRTHDLFYNREFEKAIKDLEKAISQYPDKPQFYTLLQGSYIFDGQTSKFNASVLDMYKRFPGYLFAKIPYANMLIESGKPEGVPDVFEDKSDLNFLYPERKMFHTHEAAVFLATFCRFYIAIDNLDFADRYMDAIIKKSLWDAAAEALVKKAMIELYNAKATKVREHLGWGEN